MTKISCNRCGNALTQGARFCTKCGATSSAAETVDFNALKTRPLGGEQTDQKTPGHSAVTEALPSSQVAGQIGGRTAPSNYDTEEMPRIRITVDAFESPTTPPSEFESPTNTPPEMPATESRTISPPANLPSSGRKGLLLAGALGVVVLGAGSIFYINSRRAAETQTANRPADEAKPAASAQPSVEPSGEASGRPAGAAANNQTQPQTEPTAGAIKSPPTKNTEADNRSSQQEVAKPTPAAQQEKDGGDGTGAAVHNLNQGITFINAGRYQDALREFEYVKKLDPENKSVYYLIGQTYNKMGNLEQALKAFRLCTSGKYASVALNNVRLIEKRLGKSY